MDKPRAVVYCRISQDRRGEGAGVERQRTDCMKLAKSLGWNVVHVYTDNDVSAYSGRPRPEYMTMLDHIGSGRVDGLLAWHSDRLYRSIPDLSELVKVCEDHGVEIRTVKAGQIDLSSPSGRLNATMFASIARYEVERSAERVKAAKDQQALDGKFRGGPRPFGYQDGGVELHEVEAKRLREAAEHVLSGGSLMSVTTRWNAEGFTTARGAKWTVTALRKVLLRARNAGLVEQAGTIVGPAVWPPVFDQDTLHALRAIFADPSRRTSVSYAKRWQGNGVYRCGKCGGPMKVYKMNGIPAVAYRCVDRPHLSTRREPLDEFVSELVIGTLSAPDAADVFAGMDDVDLSGLRAERDGLQARKENLASLFAAGDIDGPQLTRGSRELQVRIDEVENRLSAARESSPVGDLALAEDVRARWADLSADIRAKVIDKLMTVTVLPTGTGSRVPVEDRVEIGWKR